MHRQSHPPSSPPILQLARTHRRHPKLAQECQPWSQQGLTHPPWKEIPCRTHALCIRQGPTPIPRKHILADIIWVGVMGMMGKKGGVQFGLKVAKAAIWNGSLKSWVGSISFGILDHDVLFWMGDLIIRLWSWYERRRCWHFRNDSNPLEEYVANFVDNHKNEGFLGGGGRTLGEDRWLFQFVFHWLGGNKESKSITLIQEGLIIFYGEFVIFPHFASLHHRQSSHTKFCFALPKLLDFRLSCVVWNWNWENGDPSVVWNHGKEELETGIEIGIENLK